MLVSAASQIMQASYAMFFNKNLCSNILFGSPTLSFLGMLPPCRVKIESNRGIGGKNSFYFSLIHCEYIYIYIYIYMDTHTHTHKSQSNFPNTL